MAETQSMAEAQEAGTQPQGFLSSGLMGHRSHGEMGLLPAAAYSAAAVPRTAADTEVAEDPSDGGMGGAIVPNVSWILFATMAPNVGPLLGTSTEKDTLMWGLVVGVGGRSVATSSTENELSCLLPPSRPPGACHLMRPKRFFTEHGELDHRGQRCPPTIVTTC